MISTAMRDVLIRHLDGTPVKILRSASIVDNYEAERAASVMKTTHALLARKFLRYVGGYKPHSTVLTDAGREALAEALGDWADALVRSKYPLPPYSFQSREEASVVTESRLVVATRSESE